MSYHHWSGFQRTALAAAVAIVACAPALAQNTTSGVTGRVVDGAGKPVAGAAVSILHVESGSVANTITDADGRYAARGLRVGGPYVVTFSKGGQVDKQQGVYLQLAEALVLDGTLGAPATTTVVVTGQAVSDRINSSVMGSGTNISSRDLSAFASIAGNLQDYARTDPRLSQTDKERGEIAALGQNSRYNSILIDGVNISDTFGLEANTLPTARQPISLAAIQSVQVNLSNYDVTQKGYTGANINAVTKSGTNDFHGSVSYTYRDDSFAGDRYNRTNDTYFAPPKFKEDAKGLTVSGPIIKDKLFFFAGYEEFHSSRLAASFGPLGDAKTNVGITPSAIASAQAIASATHKIDVGTSVLPDSTELVVKDKLLKLDWNITDQHRASLRYAKTEQTDPVLGNLTATALSLSSNWYTQGKSIETLVGQLLSDWTPDFSTELKLSKRNYLSLPVNNAMLPLMVLSFSGALPPGTPSTVSTASRSLFMGTDNSRMFNQLATRTQDGYLAGTWTKGKHELKFGGDISRNEVFNAFLQNIWGNYTFSCVNSAANYTYSFGAINCGTATAAQVEAAVLENYTKGRPSSFQVQTAADGHTLDDGVARWALTSTGLFAQDTFTVSDKLNVTAGLRMDQQSANVKPIANTAAAAPMVAGVVATNTRQSGGFGLDNTTVLDNKWLVEPRVGFNFALDMPEKRKAQVRGGFGLFQGAAATVWLSNPYSNTGVATRVIGCGGSFAACPTTGGTFSPNPLGQVTSLPGNPPAANVDFIQKGLGQPAIWKTNLAFDTELPWYGLVAGAEYIYTQNDTGIYYQHLNLGTPTGKGNDGRDLFYTAQGYNPACWNATGGSITTGTTCTGLRTRALSNPNFANVLLAAKSDKGRGDALTLTIGQPSRTGFSWNAAYTRSTATEVSPLTSSVSNSNFNARSIFNPNENVAANSATLVRDRVSASLTWSKAFVGNYKTSVGVFYEGRRGHNYSWTFKNDLNGDGVAGNDLMYIPKGPQSGEVVFLNDTATSHPNEDAFWKIVEANAQLANSKGSVVTRNGTFSAFTNNFDMRLSQEVRGFAAGQKGVLTFDILNVGNLLNKKWGRIDEAAFASAGGAVRGFVYYAGLDSAGRYIYNVTTPTDLTTRQAKGESQWAMQVSLRYEF
ncbi:MAG: TonB-dependent receptor [Burkholderiales bacterium]|nr:TonB-dependent receptor [Burkholderiales bacterium]